jgi:hypothetical protein
MKSRKVLTILLSLAIMLTFMPVTSFAAEKDYGNHEFEDTLFQSPITYVDADAAGLEVLVAPTCTEEGIGVIKCDIDLNGTACGFERTVKIHATGHTAGEIKHTTALDVMKKIGYNDTRIDYFFSRNGGAYAYCECYVYVCKDCGAYVDQNGRTINAMWTNGNNPNPTAPIVCPPAGDRVAEHTKPADTPNCQQYYTCEKCGYDKCVNDKYDPDYHNPNVAGPADKDLTITYENVHQGANGQYVRTTAWTCNLCGASGKANPVLHGYRDWNQVSHPTTTPVVTTEPTCTVDGVTTYYCDDCGLAVSTAPIQKLGHQFETVTPYVKGDTDVYDDGTAIGALNYERYVYTAQVCSRCNTVVKKIPNVSVAIADFAPAAAATEWSFKEFRPATCEQGSWLEVSTKTGERIVKRYLDDTQVADMITAGVINKVGDKYYTNFPGTTFDKVEVPYTPALKHDFGEIVKVADATCEDRALEGKKCSKCGKIDHQYGVHEVGNPLGHDIKTFEVKATCGEYGYKYDTCARCQALLDTDHHDSGFDIKDIENLSAKDLESFDVAYDLVNPVVAVGTPCEFEWKVTKAPSATEDGERSLVCKNCGAVSETQVIPKDSDAAKDAAIEAADPAVKAAAQVLSDKAKYTDDSVDAIKEAKSMLNQAIAAGTAGDVTRCAELLQKAVDNAALKAANTMVAAGKTVKAKASKKTTIKKSKAFTVKNAKGKVTFKKKSGNSKVVVSKTGKVTVKKGLKKGKTYKVKVQVKAAGNGDYLAKTKTVTLKVKVVK